MIQPGRIQHLNEHKERRGRFVLYWMHASCRAACNHALEYAIRRADEMGKPLVVCFGLTPDFPGANARHYVFLLEGLRETQETLAGRGIQLVVRKGSPYEVALTLAQDACLVVTDRGYLCIQRKWRKQVAMALNCPLIQVESDVVVPVEAVSRKEEYTAATLRPKLHKLLSSYTQELKELAPRKDSTGMRFASLSLNDIPAIVRELGVDEGVSPVPSFRGGTSEARMQLKDFLDKKLRRYHEERNDPNLDAQSNLSPYLHFGQISPLEITLAMKRRRGEGKEAFLEELIVRREVSMNFVFYNQDYDSFRGLPDWCKKTLMEHEKDKREYLYDLADLEGARTHDFYWNAAQREMVLTGKMHGYMRMYWGKKILEWTERPEEGFGIALHLNNKYQLDGRDPNSFAGVAWCFGKHDRPWKERSVYGKVRCMVAAGLKRKFDIEGYVRQVELLQPDFCPPKNQVH
jgi:deoxyribodipyrimidine photo-lyase